MDNQALAVAIDRFRFYARDAALMLSQVSLRLFPVQAKQSDEQLTSSAYANREISVHDWLEVG